MRVLDLFSGVGGFSLGLERAGFETVAFCEIDDFPRKVLRKHWPDVPIYEDIRNVTNETLSRDGINKIEVICGGFPCQDISVAGKGAGLGGERSELWFEYFRIIREVGAAYVIIENVSQLRNKGLSTVLQNLSEIGYDAEWHCITAASVGAPHRRDRIWVVAYPSSRGQKEPENKSKRVFKSSNDWRILSDSIPRSGWIPDKSEWIGDNNGVSDQLHRLKALGNAVVPQIPELIGRVIMEREV
jgi:DNA (cytosine-5)-methyltransferase 1